MEATRRPTGIDTRGLSPDLDVTTVSAGSNLAGIPMLSDEEVRRRELTRTRMWAGSLLALSILAFALFTIVSPSGTWAGYLEASLEAAMVGGLADWFAVTAIFRHPLGLPIPHTAIVVERKDRFGRTLAGFMQRNFLTGSLIAERVHTSRAVPRAARWACERDNAELASRHITGLVMGFTDRLDDRSHPLVLAWLRNTLSSVPVAPALAKTLRLAREDGREAALIERGLEVAAQALQENDAALRARFTGGGPWWLPGLIQERAFDRFSSRMVETLNEARSDPAHDLRHRMSAYLDRMEHQLETSEQLAERLEAWKSRLLDSGEFARLTRSVTEELIDLTRRQSAEPHGFMSERLTNLFQDLGRRVEANPQLQERIEDRLASGARLMIDLFGDEIESLVSTTIEHWDADHTASQLELLLGRDLQFIRINGTVVGALAGLAIHGFAEALGG